MRDYARLSPQFWIGETGRAIRKLGAEAQVVALYLLSNPHATMLGLYYLPFGFLAHETGIPVEAASRAIQELTVVGFCDYDHDAEVVWVKEMARFQIGDQLDAADKRCKGIAKEYANLPGNRFLGAFFDRYAAAFHLPLRRDAQGAIQQAPPKPHTSPSEAPSEPHRSQEQETEHDPEQDLPSPSLRSGEGVAGGAVDPPPAAGPKNPTVPDCPHEEIIALYHEVLPSNPQVREWNATRRSYLRSRWREKARPNGVTQGYTTVDGGLAWWREFFAYVAESPFLTGRTNGRDGRPPFVADLEWLVKPSNFAKVIEGKYDG